MRWQEISSFTGYDFDDLSIEPWYATLMGYTQEDLEGESLAPYMTLAAHRLGITTKELLEQLKRHYGGFCFDEDAAVKVYCPYSINKFFSPLAAKEFLVDPNWMPEFKPFWMNSSHVSASLQAYFCSLALSQQELSELRGKNSSYPTMSCRKEAAYRKLRPSSS